MCKEIPSLEMRKGNALCLLMEFRNSNIVTKLTDAPAFFHIGYASYVGYCTLRGIYIFRKAERKGKILHSHFTALFKYVYMLFQGVFTTSLIDSRSFAIRCRR